MSSETKTCQNCKQSFDIEPDDFAFYEKINVPAPTWCPECRLRRRMAFRNERYIYKRKSDFSGNSIISMFPQKSYVKVYENNIWFSDEWNPMNSAKEVDFSRPFLAQFYELLAEIPVYALSILRGENSEYSNNYTSYKNCYLVFNGNYSEDCAYGIGINDSRNCLDNYQIEKCDSCYENFWIISCNNVFYSNKCEDSYNLWFSKNCVGCSDCFGCVNLRNKKFHIFNQPYSKEDYFREIKKFDAGSWQNLLKIKKQTEAFQLKFPNKFMESSKSANFSGNYVFNSKEIHESFLIADGENIRYSQYIIGGSKDCMDYTVWGAGSNMIYESVDCGSHVSNVRFSMEVWPDARDIEYSAYCGAGSNLFGCVGLRQKSYCILNKQYSKEEFQNLRNKIIENMKQTPFIDGQGRKYYYGDFLPFSFSPYPYNQSIAQEFFPVGTGEAQKEGYYWEDVEERQYSPTIKPDKLPDHINFTDESVLKEVIMCEYWKNDQENALPRNCTKGFKVISSELEFHRRFNLALPRKCPNCRHYDRTRLRGPFQLWPRQCKCVGTESENSLYKNASSHPHGEKPCQNKFKTSYAPERPEIVYCEQCYNAEVA